MRMKVHPLKIIRILVSLVIFILFSIGFFATGSLSTALVQRLTFFQFAPSFFKSVMAGGGFLAGAFIPVLIVSLLFGRIYCSGLCPFGTLQDMLIRISKPRRKTGFRYSKSRRILHYSVLGLVILTVIAGSQILVNLLEPYSLFARSVRDIGTPLITLASQGAFRILKEIEVFIIPWSFPIEFWVSLLSLFSLAVILILALRHGRFFCNRLCPVGAILRLPAKYSLFRIRIKKDACISCGNCERSCKARCIDGKGKEVDNARCISCFSCLGTCPTDAISYNFEPWNFLKSKKTDRKSGQEISRRKFLGRLSGLFGAGGLMSVFPVSFLLRKRDKGPEGRMNGPASPPGSKSIEHFTSNCVACHLCVSRCPTRVLQPSLLEYGFSSIMQPVMDYGTGFCEYQCNICSQVCPTGAILALKLEKKQQTQIGTSHFIQDRCIVFTDGTACGACAEVCPTGAVHMVPHTKDLNKPETDDTICIGCGNCEYACPVFGGKAIYVVGKKVHEEVPESAYAPKAEQLREEQSKQEKTQRKPESGEDEGKEGFPF